MTITKRVVLISTYELGRQPFGLASPAAWLAAAGAQVTCLDLAVQELDQAALAQAHLVALYLPMHTATRLAAALLPTIRRINPTAHLCGFGLYAALNADYLRKLGVTRVISGEFESGLTTLYKRLCAEDPAITSNVQIEPTISLVRQAFMAPDRSGLPALTRYAVLDWGDGRQTTTGYTEASRGCQHRCRHCPVVPVYNGRFRVVPRDVVLADIHNQVMAGAQHITFGDPDFFNGPGHAIPLVRALHTEFPTLTYDVTIKIEHLLRYADLLPALRDTGCLFVTSAVEAVDDAILARLHKGHTCADFVRAVALCRQVGLLLNPTFVAFTPWTTLTGYRELLTLLDELNLVEQIAPIQYAIRLLIPSGSRLLELDDVQQQIGAFDEAALVYPWRHPQPLVDQLQREILHLVQRQTNQGSDRRSLFHQLWQLTHAAPYRAENGQPPPRPPRHLSLHPASAVPRLSENWYC
jgi:radical SAM superfamily enzyme YgiQ (UPF0313 family)